LVFGDVRNESVLITGPSARRIFATARKMLCLVAAGFCPSVALISSIDCCSRCRSVKAARSSGVSASSTESIRSRSWRPAATRSGPGAGLASRASSGSASLSSSLTVCFRRRITSMAQLAAMRGSQVPNPVRASNFFSSV